MYNDLAPGEYQVNFLQAREYMAFSSQAKEVGPLKPRS